MYAIPNVFKFHKANAQPLLRGIVDVLDMLSISHILPHVLRSTRQSARYWQHKFSADWNSYLRLPRPRNRRRNEAKMRREGGWWEDREWHKVIAPSASWTCRKHVGQHSAISQCTPIHSCRAKEWSGLVGGTEAITTKHICFIPTPETECSEQNAIELLLNTALFGRKGPGHWNVYTAGTWCLMAGRSCFRAYRSQVFGLKVVQQSASNPGANSHQSFPPVLLTARSVYCYSYHVRTSCAWHKDGKCACKTMQTMIWWWNVAMLSLHLDAFYQGWPFFHLVCQCAVSFVQGCPHELLQI